MLLRSVRSATALAPPLSVGGDFENILGWCIYGRADDIATDSGTPMAAAATSQQVLFFGSKKNVRQHNSQNVYSYLLDTYAVVLLYAEDAEPN